MTKLSKRVGDLFTIPTGQVSIGHINAELNTTGQRSLGQADGRVLAGVPSGQISLSDYRGKSNEVTDRLTFSGKIEGTGAEQWAYSSVQSRDKVFRIDVVSNTYYLRQESGGGWGNSANASIGIQANGSSPSGFSVSTSISDIGGGKTLTHNNGRIFTGDGTQTVSLRTALFTGARNSEFARVDSHTTVVDITYVSPNNEIVKERVEIS